MSEPLDPSATPLATVDPDSLTALFDADPTTLSDAAIDAVILELRRRADAFAAEKAAEQAAPKGKTRTIKSPTADIAVQAALDKPVSELTIGDLFAGMGDGSK